MPKRKYEYYTVAFDDSEPFETECWREAFTVYQRHPGSATLYGIDEQGDIATIMSK